MSDEGARKTITGDPYRGMAGYLPPPAPEPIKRNAEYRPGRNDLCWCGSGKKYKKCHMAQDEA